MESSSAPVTPFETPISGTPDIKIRLTNVLVERGPNAGGQVNIDELVIQVFGSAEKNDLGSFHLERVSSTTWNCEADIEYSLIDNGMTIIARTERIGDVCQVHLTRNELDDLMKRALLSYTLEPTPQLDVQENAPHLTVSLEMVSILSNSEADVDAQWTLHASIYFIHKGRAHMADQYGNLGVALWNRSNYTGDLVDISGAISSLRKAIDLTPEVHNYTATWSGSLGNALRSRFNRTGDLADISAAISTLQNAVDLTPKESPYIGFQLASLGAAFHSRFNYTDNLEDITKAISTIQDAVRLTPPGHEMAIPLGNLALALKSRFDRTGDLEDVNKAISAFRKCVDLTPKEHGNAPVWLGNLGNALHSRFNRTENPADISEAISYLHKAIKTTPEGHANMGLWLGKLGRAHFGRFSRTGDLGDISEVITLLQKSVKLTPEGPIYMGAQLTTLGAAFHIRFIRTGDLPDISEAISNLREAIRLTPEKYIDIGISLGNLGVALHSRFNRTQDITDIDEAISTLEKCVENTPEQNANLAAWLGNLGNALCSRFKYTKNFADISRAISIQERAITFTPEGHPNIATHLIDLAQSFYSRFSQTGDLIDLKTAVSKCRLVATSSTSPPSKRLLAARSWAEWSKSYDSSDSLVAYDIVIEAVSQVVGLDQTTQKRWSNLVDISDLSTTAAAFAISQGHQGKAIEWLEQGRCLVWSQLNSLRTPLEDLRDHNPALADQLSELSKALELADSREEFIPGVSTQDRLSLQDEATAHIKLAREWDQLITKIRDIEGFKDFLRPSSCSDVLKYLPSTGHVAIINVHRSRCDALALMFGIDTPLHIPLANFSYNQAEDLRSRLQKYLHSSGLRMRGAFLEADRLGDDVMEEVLSELWTSVVQPILNGLGHSCPPSELSRIWWCATGPLAFLPIHAAGIYTASSEDIISKFAISSYTPTVSALTQRVKNPQDIKQEYRGVFMVSQSATPGLTRIPGTTEEVRAIAQQLKDHNMRFLCLEGRNATINQGLANMETHSCIHLACHARQNLEEPLKSGFFFHDGQLELSFIIKKQLVGADLAFLSACQTSAGDEKLSEEAVHLAAGMLAAGYRGVVATMWSIQDRHGPQVAQDFYANLIGDEERSGLDGSNAAHALHYATQKLREEVKDLKSSLLIWVPYVHFGL